MEIAFFSQLLWASHFDTCFSFNLHNNSMKSYKVFIEDLAAEQLVLKLRSLTLKPIPYLPYHIVSPMSHEYVMCFHMLQHF